MHSLIFFHFWLSFTSLLTASTSLLFAGSPTSSGNTDASGPNATFNGGAFIMTTNPVNGLSLLSSIKGQSGQTLFRTLSSQAAVSRINFNNNLGFSMSGPLTFDSSGALYVQSTACTLLQFPQQLIPPGTTTLTNFAGVVQVKIFPPTFLHPPSPTYPLLPSKILFQFSIHRSNTYTIYLNFFIVCLFSLARLRAYPYLPQHLLKPPRVILVLVAPHNSWTVSAPMLRWD